LKIENKTPLVLRSYKEDTLAYLVYETAIKTTPYRAGIYYTGPVLPVKRKLGVPW